MSKRIRAFLGGVDGASTLENTIFTTTQENRH
jgi:hypothetical protein